MPAIGLNSKGFEMKILFIHSLMFHHRTWKQAADRLGGDGIELSLADQASALALLDDPHAKPFDLLIAELGAGLPDFEALMQRCRSISQRIGLSPDMPSEFTTVAAGDAAELRAYLQKVSLVNYLNGLRFIAAQSGMEVAFEPPAPVRTTGIYHPEAAACFDTVEDYKAWLVPRLKDRSAPWVGLLFYYSQLVEENTADVDAIILALESQGVAPLGLFCAGAEDAAAGAPDGPQWLALLRQPPGVEAVLSLMAGRLLKKKEQSALLEQLDVPVIQLLRSHHQTPDQWRDDPQGLAAMTAVYSLAQPETFGVAAPMMVAGTAQAGPDDPLHGSRTYVPIDERVRTLCRRVRRWIRLRRLANHDKRITFVLHNNPCKGVEATVGMAVGLDTFESLARVLQTMKSAGYDVGQAPAAGREILDEIMNRKAVAEFRWTTVDEIVAKGGALYMMDRDEYGPWFETVPQRARTKVLDDWDDFPGQGMAFRRDGVDLLVITGIQYGRIRIMVQPKRGCYGPKCTGEVCRILHDPELAPPHHWLATYKYIRDHSDAVVHFGTEGALEFLPGKQAALSDACFPEISIGDLPHLYVYVMDATGEGLTAKRRARAILVDHLTPVYRPAPSDDKIRQTEALLDQYQKALTMGETGRLEILGRQVAPLLVDCGLVDTVPTIHELPGAATSARRQIDKIKRCLMPEGMHLLSRPPGKSGTARILATILQAPPSGLPDLETIAAWSGDPSLSVYEGATSVLERLIAEQPVKAPEAQRALLADYCRDVADRIAGSSCEIEHLLRGLDGRFIPPGLSGSLSRGTIDALPTGRNFFAVDVTCLPTRAAWNMGEQMAHKLLFKYLEDEGRFPESVGISIWSSDAYKSDGELLCQILALMGARPVWDRQERVGSTEPIDLGDLFLTLPDGSRKQRPRVDVTIQTSSLMRDLVPNFCDLMDRTVGMLSRLDEPDEWNAIRKHTRQQMEQLGQQAREAISDSRLRRLATLRIFSSAPGTYGLGVGLALDASAWQDKKDLAEVYINWGGHAYGVDDGDHSLGYGEKAQQVLADQLARIDVAYMKQASAEYDVLDCGCYAVFQGGMATAAAAVGRKNPKLYWGDSTLPTDADVGDLADEINRSARAKLLNSAWIEQMRRHGYQGAQAAASRVNNLFKWSATSQQVPGRLFDDVVRTYVADQENRTWLRESNPYALEEITRRLLEAASRGLWDAKEVLLADVRSAALEIEGDMEEIMGDVDGEFQGGKVDVLTAADVDKWDMEWRIGDR
jgi:cobaltochelatase CobN